MELTQIQVKKETKESLKKLRLVDRESYDSVINRLLKNKKVKKKNV